MEEPHLNIPVPVSFNPLKHHFSYQQEFIRKMRIGQDDSFGERLLSVGNNVIDVYCGKLTIAGLCNEVIENHVHQGLKSANDLITWLGKEEYRLMKLSDGSAWVIRVSGNEDRQVHIHPAKKSDNTFRIKGTTLKTVMAICCLTGELQRIKDPDIIYVNKVRKEMLGLSPVKNLSENSRILKWMQVYRLPDRFAGRTASEYRNA